MISEKAVETSEIIEGLRSWSRDGCECHRCRTCRLGAERLAVLSLHEDPVRNAAHHLLDAAVRTVEENLHLADGTNCTLRHLKVAIAKAESTDPITREDDPRYRAKSTRTIPLTTLKWWRELVDLNPRDLAPRLDAVIVAEERRDG